MPSEAQAGDRESTERPYDVDRVVDEIGEDPGRWLDRDLTEHGVVRITEKDHYGDYEASHTLVTDPDVSTPGKMALDRIAGIDHFQVVQVWRMVEKSLDRTPEGGRDRIIAELDARIAELEEQGEREIPYMSPKERRERAAEAFEAVAPKGPATYRGLDGEETPRNKGGSASEKIHAMRAAGGDGN